MLTKLKIHSKAVDNIMSQERVHTVDIMKAIQITPTVESSRSITLLFFSNCFNSAEKKQFGQEA